MCACTIVHSWGLSVCAHVPLSIRGGQKGANYRWEQRKAKVSCYDYIFLKLKTMTTTACLLHSPYTTIPFAQEMFSLPAHKTKMAFIMRNWKMLGTYKG